MRTGPGVTVYVACRPAAFFGSSKLAPLQAAAGARREWDTAPGKSSGAGIRLGCWSAVASRHSRAGRSSSDAVAAAEGLLNRRPCAPAPRLLQHGAHDRAGGGDGLRFRHADAR